jgi:hypothetical protein
MEPAASIGVHGIKRAVLLLGPAPECRSCPHVLRFGVHCPRRAQRLRTQPRTAFPGSRILSEYLQVPTTFRHVQNPSDRADATHWVMTDLSLPQRNGAQMRKNYHQVRKQRELARKVRQQEKQQRRSARLSAAAATPAVATPQDDSAAAPEPILRGAP